MSIQNHHIITPCFLSLSASFNTPSPSGGFCCRVSAVACLTFANPWCWGWDCVSGRKGVCLPENVFQVDVDIWC